MSSTVSDDHQASVVEEPGKDKVAAYRQYLQSPSDPERSDEELKSWFSNYGSIWMSKLTNKTSHKLTFYNPWRDVSGEIAAGDDNTSSASGYMPLWSNDKYFEITYYNQVLREEKKLVIKDLDGSWLLSFYQAGRPQGDEDIRRVCPQIVLATYADLQLTILDSGYELYQTDVKCVTGRMSWQPI